MSDRIRRLTKPRKSRLCITVPPEFCCFVLPVVLVHVSSALHSLYCSVPLGVVCTAFLSLVWIYLLEVPSPSEIPNYPQAVIAFAVCSVAELLAEPIYVLAQRFFYVRVKVSIAFKEFRESVSVVNIAYWNCLSGRTFTSTVNYGVNAHPQFLRKFLQKCKFKCTGVNAHRLEILHSVFFQAPCVHDAA